MAHSEMPSRLAPLIRCFVVQIARSSSHSSLMATKALSCGAIQGSATFAISAFSSTPLLSAGQPLDPVRPDEVD